MARKVKNYLVNSRYQGLQLGHAIGAYLLGCTSMGIASFIAYGFFMKKFAKNDALIHLQSFEFITATWLPVMAGVCFVVGLLVVVPFSLFLSHRTAGPIIAIKRYIRSLKEGNYDASIELRDGDELKEIASDLQDFAKVMKRAA